MTPYATSVELDAWLPDGIVVPDATRLLTRASELLDAVVRRPFTLDDNDLPTDPKVKQALSDAACAQVECWLEVGEDHDIGGLAGRQVSIGHLSVNALPNELSPRAERALRAAGLLSSSALATTAYRFFATEAGS